MVETVGKRRENQKKRIIDAAIELFAERGYFGTSIRDLAGELQVQISTIYVHFPAKERILSEIMEHTMLALNMRVEAAVQAAGDDPSAQLSAAVTEHVSFHGEHARAAFVTDSELRALEPSHRYRIVDLRDRHQAIFEDIIERGTSTGTFCVDDVKVATYAVTTMCTAVGTWYRPEGRLPLGVIASEYSKLTLRGMRCAEASPP